MGDYLKRFSKLYFSALGLTTVLFLVVYLVASKIVVNFQEIRFPENISWLLDLGSLCLTLAAFGAYTSVLLDSRLTWLKIAIAFFFTSNSVWSYRNLHVVLFTDYIIWIYFLFLLSLLFLALYRELQVSEKGRFYVPANLKPFLVTIAGATALAFTESFLFSINWVLQGHWESLFSGLHILVMFPITIFLTTIAYWFYSTRQASNNWYQTKSAIFLLLISLAAFTVKNPIANALWVFNLVVFGMFYRAWLMREKKAEHQTAE